MKMNFTTPLEMPGDTLGCQIKSWELLSLSTVVMGSQERYETRKASRVEERENQGKQIMKQRDEDGGEQEGGNVLKRNSLTDL